MDAWLHNWIFGLALSNELLSVFILIFSCGLLLFFTHIGGLLGLISYINLAYLAANIQVLHQAEFYFLTHPVALGTILFSTTYIATDLITEVYGAKEARLSVGLSFITQIGFTTLMLLTLLHPPLPHVAGNTQIHQSLTTLFLPLPRLMVASLLAYFCSQLADIWIFSRLSKLTHQKALWLRSFVSTSLSALLDNFIFSIIAFMLLSPAPIDFKTLLYTYILGTYGTRLVLSFLGVPVLYLGKKLAKR